MSKLETDLLQPWNSSKWKSTGHFLVNSYPLPGAAPPPVIEPGAGLPLNPVSCDVGRPTAHHESPHWSGKGSINKNNSSPFHLWIVGGVLLKIWQGKTEGAIGAVVVTFIGEWSTPTLQVVKTLSSKAGKQMGWVQCGGNNEEMTSRIFYHCCRHIIFLCFYNHRTQPRP